MPRYLNSTHQKNWIFSQEELEKINESKQSQVLERITAGSSDPNIHRYVITQIEELSIIHYLSLNLITVCRHLLVHDKAISTALAYYKRFYLFNSVCEYDPVQMMFTSMFLACKTEEINIRDIHHFCQNFKESDPNAILQLEYSLLSGIRFHLYVFSPYKPLRALLGFISEEMLNTQEKNECEIKAKEIIESCLISDISVKYSPSEIAVGSLYMSLETCSKKDEIFSAVFQFINKDFTDQRERVFSLINEYGQFKANTEKIDVMFRGALKKANSLRHRIKKLQKTEESLLKQN